MAPWAKQPATSGQRFFCVCVTCVCVCVFVWKCYQGVSPLQRGWPRVVSAEAWWLVGTWLIEARCYSAFLLCYVGGEDLGDGGAAFYGFDHCNPWQPSRDCSLQVSLDPGKAVQNLRNQFFCSVPLNTKQSKAFAIGSSSRWLPNWQIWKNVKGRFSKLTSSWTFCWSSTPCFLLLRPRCRRLGRCSSKSCCFNVLTLIGLSALTASTVLPTLTVLVAFVGKQAYIGECRLAQKKILRKFWRGENLWSRCQEVAVEIGKMARMEIRLWGDILFEWPAQWDSFGTLTRLPSYICHDLFT